MSQKTLLAVGVILFFVATAFLFSRNHRALDPQADQGWWSVAFAKPQDQTNLSFIIDNRTPDSVFTYEIKHDDVSWERREVRVELGTQQLVSIQEPAPPDGRTAVTVTQGQTSQSIYR